MIGVAIAVVVIFGLLALGLHLLLKNTLDEKRDRSLHPDLVTRRALSDDEDVTVG